jgi:uncharacterized integral membrane protein (TIGR00698 family)
MNYIISVKKNVPGILLCAIIALPSYFLGKLVPVVGGPVFAILIGMCLALILKNRSAVQNGISYTAKKILQYAVILLGFGMNISVILTQGAHSLPVIITTITTALLTAFIASKLLKTPKKVSQLIGIGSCICGGSAIAAAAPVIEADDSEIAQSISVIFLFNIIAALIFPALGGLLGLTNDGFALFAGTAVNDTSSVTATAAAWDGIHGSNTLEGATIVKLTRTLAIIPITLVLALFQMHAAKNKEKNVCSTFHFAKIFPFFVLYFLLASVITTIFNLSPAITDPLKWLSKFFIIMAMSAIGLNTNIIKLVKTGGKPILLGFICWFMISAASLLMQHVLGYW